MRYPLIALVVALTIASVAMAQDPLLATDLPGMSIDYGTAATVPWVTSAIAIVSTVVLILREASKIVDKLHGCQPTIRILHVNEDCPRCAERDPEASGRFDRPHTDERSMAGRGVDALRATTGG